MAKCPKDADTNNLNNAWCYAIKDGYVCTRDKGHKGKHHAHVGDKCLAIW